ncbi:type III PLP-dependent enzyme domain-containing protein [Pararhodonellum marinum]|uniref:Y4yA family PLP-dependent enzyme n=1 Tax=Pararhodonellum marinum TaxID=2755358 RepID=UPI0018900DE1|nr:Y4yA family PLP-dependent enzyme [Pararhodonellum marinum]
MNNQIPKLTPITHSWVKNIVSERKYLFDWINQYNSPINLINLKPFRENHDNFENLFKKMGLKGEVFFARKANKCKAFVYAAKQHKFGVDTASLNEVKDCVNLGFDPAKVTVTAAIKNKALLKFLIAHEMPVVLDNEDECILLHQLLEEHNRMIKVGFRVSGFEFQGKKLYSRFGFDSNAVVEFIQSNLGKGKRFYKFAYEGLHFHLNGYSTAERSAALGQCIELSDELAQSGYQTQFIDIGGGILINYLKRKREWTQFNRQLKSSISNEDHKELTFKKHPLGMVKTGKKLQGEPLVYPYFNELNQADFVESILIAQKAEKPLFHHLIDRDITLRLEPGRSMLDQCGITVARVAYRKNDSENRLLIGLEMNRTQLSSSSADFLLDPLFVPQEENAEGRPCEGYLVGAYCLEQDLILKRKLSFSQMPQVGDLFVFVNTAGYMMHFYESEAHGLPLSQNLIVENGNQDVIPDEAYFDYQKKKKGKAIDQLTNISAI